MPPAALSDRSARAILAALTALALGLRIACARGAPWLDEAWSAVLAHEVGTPAGVLFGINHDNNHHLNSLWLQAVGLDAPSWLMRAPAILAGTLAVPVAASIAATRGRVAAMVAALLFAVSPMLVTLGSEARGYAPMALALLVALLLVDRTLADDAYPAQPRALALCFALGALSQLTMVFGVVALCGWALLSWWQRESFGQAVRRSLALFGAPLLALVAVLALVALGAWASPAGFRFGSYDPFRWADFAAAVTAMLGYSVGLVRATVLLPIAALALLALGGRLRLSRMAFYALAVAAFPATLALLRGGNPGYPRYYLLAAVALLLLLAEVLAAGLARRGLPRTLAAAMLAVIAVASLHQDLALARDRRGDPAAAIAALAARAPGGTTVLVDRPAGSAVLTVAAAQARYPLRQVERPCPAAPFVFLARARGEPSPPGLVRCGAGYRPIAQAEPHGLSGAPWTLYARTS